MNYEHWKLEWKKILRIIEKNNGEIKSYSISDKASIEEVEKVETDLGCQLPISFKKTLLEFSSAVNLVWYLPNNIELPLKFKGIFSGECSWSLENLISINRDKDEFVKACFADLNDEYSRVWHNKLAFLDVGNGDYIAFDLEDGADPQVVFLSHDGDVTNGYILASSFIEYINELTGILCCGPEDWQMIPFIESSNSGINSKCSNSNEFKKLLAY